MEEHFESDASKKDVVDFILGYLHVDAYGANSIYEYFWEQYKYAELPHDRKLLIEQYQEGSRTYVVFHALYGRRTNDVLSRAIAYGVAQLTGKDAEVNISDNGFYIVSSNAASPARALRGLKGKDLREIMRAALDKSEVLTRRFRHCAGRALMILRSYMGRKKSVGRQQMSARLIYSAVKKISDDFPILKEARREVLEDMMDILHAQQILEWISSGKIEVREITTDIPSPFAFNLITMGYSDVMRMEDKQKFLQRMHELVLAKISLKEGKARR
jgi:ATP-dependent Lhr-like helicase